ncbi:MAG: hypothetical protein KDN19_07120 [Verrucomicrobiae bacterium]|nr:hypothetical protein [Verrucomicrobiae bacterium]
MSTPQLFNAGEAILWMALGALFLVRAIVARPHRIPWFAAVAFLAFGASDLVEIQTGAWWKPWWLLLWKAACIVGLFALWLHFRRIRREFRDGSQ